MTITSVCRGCGKTLAVADQYAGRQARCPQCATVYTVPMSSTVIVDGPPSTHSQQQATPTPTKFSNLETSYGTDPFASAPARPENTGDPTANPALSRDTQFDARLRSDLAPIDLGSPLAPNYDASNSSAPPASSVAQNEGPLKEGPLNEGSLGGGSLGGGSLGGGSLGGGSLGGGSLGGVSSMSGGSSPADALYWMRAANGAEYGPADAATLIRWFNENRVGQNYQIRQGEYGTWEPAVTFQPMAMQTTINPYATLAGVPGGSLQGSAYSKSDQSGLILAMGILAWLGFCPVFGVVAWVVGAQALTDMQQGTADPSTRGLVQVGYYLGMINVILWMCCIGMMFFGTVISAVA